MRTKQIIWISAGLAAVIAGAGFGWPVLWDSGRLRAWNWDSRFKLTQNIEYARVDGQPLLLDLYEPAAKSTPPRPAVVFIHGGGWALGHKERGANYCPELAMAGYVVVSVSFRSSLDARFPAQLDDCRAAVRWLRANAAKYNIDPQRIASFGESSGGHLAALLALNGGDESVQACVDWFGPSDLRVSAAADWNGYGVKPVRPLLGGLPEEVPQLAAQASPVAHVSPDAPPFFIVHGERDGKVPIAQSRRLHSALVDAGAEAELVEVYGGGHGRFWLTTPTHGGLLQRSLEFLDDALLLH